MTLTSSKSGTFWFIVRGVEALPVVLGELSLLDLANIGDPEHISPPAPTPGPPKYTQRDFGQDGETVGVSGPGDSDQSPWGESLFGHTAKNGAVYSTWHGTLSAYKTHDRDPLLFEDGFKLMFRNNEVTTGCGDTEHCPNQYCRPGEQPKHFDDIFNEQTPSRVADGALYRTLVWVYEWPQAPAHAETPLRLIARLGMRGLLSVEEEAAIQERLLANEPRLEAALTAYAKEAADHALPRVAELVRRLLRPGQSTV